ncbi:hypothetical protein [Nannocystis pusilla]|uniref:hypothetical protein n=1 Tax=Nannocystis pusilla TaxID=889268 RepID=UPI003B7E3C9F
MGGVADAERHVQDAIPGDGRPRVDDLTRVAKGQMVHPRHEEPGVDRYLGRAHAPVRMHERLTHVDGLARVDDQLRRPGLHDVVQGEHERGGVGRRELGLVEPHLGDPLRTGRAEDLERQDQRRLQLVAGSRSAAQDPRQHEHPDRAYHCGTSQASKSAW